MSGPGCSPGTPAGAPTGSSWASGSVKRDTLVALLQQLTDGVVGLIEGLSVEKECLESQMLQANEEAQQLRRQVCMARAACGPGSVSAMGCSCACARSCLAASADFTESPSPLSSAFCPMSAALCRVLMCLTLPHVTSPLPIDLQVLSFQAVLTSLQSHTALEHREALVALEQAHQRVAELEAGHAELAGQAQHAQQETDAVRASAAREWSSMRDDLATLVHQAEQAQLSADAACQRQRDEYEQLLAKAQQAAADATAGRAAAESAAEVVRRELAAAQQRLAAAEQRAAAVEAAASGGLQASQAAVAALEAQVSELQRQLAARLGGKGVSAAPAKKAAAASREAALLKPENQRLRAQAASLQEQASREGCI